MVRPILFVAAAISLVGLLFLSQQKRGPVVVSGFIEADEVRVGSRVGGRVARVLVEEGATVAPGAVLVELEPYDLQAKLAEARQVLAQTTAVHDRMITGFRHEEIGQAEAKCRELQAEVDKLRNGPRPQEIAAAESNLRLAEAQFQLASKVYQRVESLFGKQAADKNTMDEAATQVSVAQAGVDAKTEDLALLKEGSRPEDILQAQAQLESAEQALLLKKNGYRSEDVREARAKLDAAAAAVQVVEAQLQELNITSPAKAVVEAIDLQPGDLLSANAPAVSLIETQRMWVRAYVPENHLHLQNGQSVDVRIDSFPRKLFAGTIVFVARQAEFTPANVQTPEERSKQVFRIKVQLNDGGDVLRPGMAADVILAEMGGRS